MGISLFEANWQNAEKDIFRLEALPEYAIDELEFEKWKNGEDSLNRDERNWLALLENTRKKGLRIMRVRVVDSLSDYLRFEIDFWKQTMAKGEEVFFLTRNAFNRIRTGFDPGDFWLFDNKKLLIFQYDARGEWKGEELVEAEEVIEEYKKLKGSLLKSAVPMLKFLQQNGQAGI